MNGSEGSRGVRAGGSGNRLELLTFSDGRKLVRKEVSQEWDRISRATGDDGRVVRVWESGLFDRLPPSIEHATVAAEREGDRWSVLGLTEDRVVVVDWGERTGGAPAPVELASFLVFDAKRLDVSRDDVVADFRSLYGDRVDERAVELAIIGGVVQLGCHFTLPIALGGGEEARAAARTELDWWIPKVAAALERWSPV